ncbi:MAG: outer membrane protein assembly factor BamA [Ignavibacteriae bacterium]|nr:outer membrane protein assembly factor BamA [Ignavibacteriota bacterium]
MRLIPSKTTGALIAVVFFLLLGIGFAQQPPRKYKIAGISVEGNKFSDEQTIISLSGLRVGSEVDIPGRELQDAIKSLWLRNQFSDVDIVVEKSTPLGVFFTIKVKEYSRFSWLEVIGSDKVSYSDIKKAVGHSRGDILSPYDAYLSAKAVKALYDKEGMMYATVKPEIVPTDTASYSRLVLTIQEGVEFHVSSVSFTGNTKVSSGDLEGALEDTHSKPWWKFWRSSKFDKNKYDEDKVKLIQEYKRRGFIDAEIIRDTLKFDPPNEEVAIQIDVREGKQFILRSVHFEGNTVYPEELLIRRLSVRTGEPYDVERFDKNLSANEDQTDVASLYLDNGYLSYQGVKEEKRVGEDSVDIVVRVFEKDRFTIRRVEIIGNTKTKDKVIRRELYTRPGDYFSRSAIIRSIRALGVLNYFNPEALQHKDLVKPVDNTRVDVIYKVEERSTDTFNASLGVAGSLGLTGSVGVTFNNFSISEPLRGGGGQILNINAEFGQGSTYQTTSISFTEPWLNNEPTTLGVNLYRTRQQYTYDLEQIGGQINIGRRLRWPDDYFRVDGSLRIQSLNNRGSSVYAQGLSSEISVGGSISRVSLDNLVFPTSGSKFIYSSQIALGSVGLGTTDYWKNSVQFEFINPLLSIDGNTRLVLYLTSDMGYVTGVGKDTTNIPPNQRFYMGGNGLGGFNLTPLRGYPDNSLGPINSDNYVLGGRLMMRHNLELRFALSLNPMPIYLLAFAEAGNVWDGLQHADPFDLKRSAGVGVRLLLNPIGLLGFDYGYGFDPIGAVGEKSGWRFHFQFGR